MLLGTIASTPPIDPRPVGASSLRRWVPWLVPLAAAATVVTLWIATPNESPSPVSSVTPVTEQQPTLDTASRAAPPKNEIVPQAPPQTTVERRTAPNSASEKAAPEAPAREAALQKEEAKPEASSLNQQERAVPSTAEAPTPSPAQSANAAAPAPRAAIAARPFGALADSVTLTSEIVSPEPMVRWRISGATVEHSTNGGMSWERLATGVSTPLTAGAAPSTTICWLVGRGGVVLLANDGLNFRRVTFPETTDLSAVQATDGATASVSTADGRTFSTTDGGLTWSRRN